MKYKLKLIVEVKIEADNIHAAKHFIHTRGMTIATGELTNEIKNVEIERLHVAERKEKKPVEVETKA